MKMLPVFEIQHDYSLGLRFTALATLMVFCFVVLLGFTIAVELKPKPAKAFLGVGDFGVVIDPSHISISIGNFLANQAMDFIKAVAKAFILQLVANLLIKMMQKLESLHVIQNFLYYSDALAFDKYAGASLNKMLGVNNDPEFVGPPTPAGKGSVEGPPKPGETQSPSPPAQSGSPPAPQEAETDLGVLSQEATGLSALKPRQVEALANLNSQIVAPQKPAQVYKIGLVSTKSQIQKGDSAELSWEIEGEGIQTVKLCTDTVSLVGKSTVSPTQTTTYILRALSATASVAGENSVTITVPGTTATTCQTSTPLKSGGGLTPAQEKKLLRGTLASLVSQMSCGGVNTQVVRNMAIYNAAKVRGVDPQKIDPTSGNFYTDMAHFGNPFASPDFQELVMRDTAASIDAQAQGAIQQELSSNGLKALRSEKNNISRTSQTISDQISNAFGKAIDSAIHASDSAFASTMGTILANMVVSFIFQNKGQLVLENSVCGIGRATAGEIYLGGVSAGSAGKASVKVNDKDVASADVGDSATLTWKVDIKNADGKPEDGEVRITNYPCGDTPSTTGTCRFKVEGETTFELHFIHANGQDDTLGRASVNTIESKISLDATPNPSFGPGSDVTLSWSSTNPNLDVQIFGIEGVQPAQGSLVVKPMSETTYTVTAFNRSTGAEVARDSVTVRVQQLQSVTPNNLPVNTQSANGTQSPGFNVRE